jgi:tetratricopeptide (TPR) repeat protein
MFSKRRNRILALLIIIIFVFFSCYSKTPKKAKTSYHLFKRSRIYYEQGRVKEALSEINEAIKLDPEDARFYQFLGYVHFSMGNFKEAEEAYNRTLEIKPDLTDARNHLGALYVATNRLDEALEEFRIALKDRFYPTPEIIYFHLGELYRKKNNLEEAAAHLRRALEINPKYYRVHYELGNILSEMGDMQEAIFEYKVVETNKIYQRDPDFHLVFAMAYLKAGQRDKAKEHLLKVVELAPGTPNYIRAREILDTLE